MYRCRATTDFPARAAERVQFESARYQIGPLQQRLARERGESIVRPRAEIIDGYLTKPAGFRSDQIPNWRASQPCLGAPHNHLNRRGDAPLLEGRHEFRPQEWRE